MDAKRVRLFHSDAGEAKSRVRELKTFGYRVEWTRVGPEVLRNIRKKPPAAFIIDLARAPAQGRDIGIYIRHHKATRYIPIVFVNGAAEKATRVRKHLPDAIYTEWYGIKKALEQAIMHPAAQPRVPKSLFAAYAGTPLVKKLGIKPHDVVLLIDAPSDFPKVLVDLPEGVVLKGRLSSKNDLAIWFVKSQGVLNRRIKKITRVVGQGGLWIVWPKSSSGISSDLTQTVVRQAGLGVGLVDYRVCAVDQIWSGLKFAVRKKRFAVGGKEGA